MPENKLYPDNTPLALASAIGADIRARRKLLKVSATVAAESAGLSRMTWYRIERGETSVALGAYLTAAHVVGLTVRTMPWNKLSDGPDAMAREGWIPVSIPLAEFPQLRKLAWQVVGVDALTPAEALDIYERNWRHLDESSLIEKEAKLISALKAAFNREF